MIDKTIGYIKKAAKEIQELPRDKYILSDVINKHDITFRELFIDLDRAINRIIALCNTRNQFKDISSYSQRDNILKHLKSIRSAIEKGNDFLLDLDKLKLEIKEFAYMKYVKASAKDIEAEAAKLKKEIITLKKRRLTCYAPIQLYQVKFRKSKIILRNQIMTELS